MPLPCRVPSWPLRKFLTTNLERDEAGEWRWIIDLPAITAALPTLERTSLAPGDRYAGPAVFISGGRSDYVSPDDRPAIRAHFPQAQFAVLPESGHNPHMETRDAFVAAVLSATA